MRRLIYQMVVSLDGYIEVPDQEHEWVIDDELRAFISGQYHEIDTYLYGRRTYEIMAGFRPTADADPAAPADIVEFARIWKAMPKVVFSTTLERVNWNAGLVRDNIADEVKRLKEQSGRSMVAGGPSLAATFMQLDLIDEYRLIAQPVVLGGGTPMFPALTGALNLRLVETHTFSSGVVYLSSERTSWRVSEKRRVHVKAEPFAGMSSGHAACGATVA